MVTSTGHYSQHCSQHCSPLLHLMSSPQMACTCFSPPKQAVFQGNSTCSPSLLMQCTFPGKVSQQSHQTPIPPHQSHAKVSTAASLPNMVSHYSTLHQSQTSQKTPRDAALPNRGSSSDPPARPGRTEKRLALEVGPLDWPPRLPCDPGLRSDRRFPSGSA